MASNRNARLRQRIVRLFKVRGVEKLTTREIMQGLQTQLQSNRPTPYKTNPTINELINVMKRHPEFKTVKNEKAYISYTGNNSRKYEVCLWKLSNKGREML